MLFVIAMEGLNQLLKAAEQQALLHSFGHDGIKERAYFYADDVVFFIKPVEQDLVITTMILDIFGMVSGLQINRAKCVINPIQCNLEDSVTLVRFCLGSLQPFPCKYLGIPLSVYKLKKEALQPLINKVATGLPTWKAGLLTQAVRAILVKAKMSAVPVHTAIATTISPWVIRMMDKRRRAFLWKGTAAVSGCQCKLAWPRVCRPMVLAGLGFPNLELMGYALRLRWLWLRRTDAARP
jgi:hypothetical protein